jgi:hypothetical protein
MSFVHFFSQSTQSPKIDCPPSLLKSGVGVCQGKAASVARSRGGFVPFLAPSGQTAKEDAYELPVAQPTPRTGHIDLQPRCDLVSR